MSGLSTPPSNGRKRIGTLLIFVWLALQCHLARAAPMAVVTILEGNAQVLRDGSKFTLAKGVPLQADDLLHVGATDGFLRVEFFNGLSVSLGPSTRASLGTKLPGTRGTGTFYLLQGSMKVNSTPSASAKVMTPVLDAMDLHGDTVIAVFAGTGEVFAESSEVSIGYAREQRLRLKSGEFLHIGSDATPKVLARPTAAFVQALPRAFLETLPPRVERIRSTQVQPKRLGQLSYADLQPWLNAEPVLRGAYLPRWRSLAQNPQFRAGLLSELKLHPEWAAVLFPSEEKRPAVLPDAH